MHSQSDLPQPRHRILPHRVLVVVDERHPRDTALAQDVHDVLHVLVQARDVRLCGCGELVFALDGCYIFNSKKASYLGRFVE